MLDLSGIADVVALDLNFLGGSAYDDDIGVWNGTGTCSTHHGEADCYADVYNLCARQAAGDQGVSGYWPFTECMFASQGELCPDTWTGEDCGASAYNASAFDAVVARCSASMGEAAAAAVVECAVAGSSHGSMADAGKQLLVDNFAASEEGDPSGHPVWIVVDGTLVDENAYADVDAWGVAVLASVCESYQKKNPSTALPDACQ